MKSHAWIPLLCLAFATPLTGCENDPVGTTDTDATDDGSSTDDSTETSTETSNTGDGDGDGDGTTGDGDGTTGDGTTGDGDGTTGDGTTGDGDGTTGDGTTGDGDGDGTTGDGDGTSTGDGDGDGTSTGDGDGTSTGDGDGDGTSTGDGDGDGTSTGDGDGDGTSAGDGDGTSAGDGDGDGSTTVGDGDGDGTTAGDGDGDGTTGGDGDGTTGGDGDGDGDGTGGDGDGDGSTTVGDGDGDGTSAGDGDGDGDGTTTGDGDGDGFCGDGIVNGPDEQCEPIDPGNGCSINCWREDECGNALYECGNGLDDDNDGLIDELDPECTSPCDDNESSFKTDIPGQNNDCTSDCYWDGDSGSGNDGCEWNLKCDELNPGEVNGCEVGTCSGGANAGDFCVSAADCPGSTCGGAPPGSADCTLNNQTQGCIDVCAPLTPNGCDCFGCCIFEPADDGLGMTVPCATDAECQPYGSYCDDRDMNPANWICLQTVYLDGQEDPPTPGNCSITTAQSCLDHNGCPGGETCIGSTLCSFDYPDGCTDCTFQRGCANGCDPCETCFGDPPGQLPPGCVPTCSGGATPCDLDPDCGVNEFCQTGCCTVIPV